jgi:hypothetical protein
VADHLSRVSLIERDVDAPGDEYLAERAGHTPSAGQLSGTRNRLAHGGDPTCIGRACGDNPGDAIGSMFVNATPFAALDVPLLDPLGREVVVAIVKATFQIGPQGRARLADVQVPIRTTAILLDPDAPASSVKYPSDVCVAKGGTDVIVVGEAVAPTPVAAMDVAVKVRETTAPLRVHGPRVYYRSVAQVVVGPPARFERVPIVYERAYGGATADQRIVELRNPVGTGVAHRDADLVDRPAPQIEHPAYPHQNARDRHPPAGYGALAPDWSPRRERWGTADEVWATTRMYLAPKDYDVRHENAAHPSLLFEQRLAAGDAIGILGMTEDGFLGFELPDLRIVVRGRFDGGEVRETRPEIDTVIVEPSARTVQIAARASFPLGRAKALLRELTADVDG